MMGKEEMRKVPLDCKKIPKSQKRRPDPRFLLIKGIDKKRKAVCEKVFRF